jgi:hypothetical protein
MFRSFIFLEEQIMKYAALIFLLATLGLTPIAAQETSKAQPDFVLVNNTGEEISSILIIPSAKKYKSPDTILTTKLPQTIHEEVWIE